jgi:peptidoglycan hydrolase-like protein with peptidoglycan-binding domain
MASAQAPGQAQSGSSSSAQTQRHEGSSAQQTKEQPGQARHEQGMTQGKSGTAAQAQPQRNEGKAQHEPTTGQNVEKQKPAARSEGNRERTTGQGGQATSQPQQGQTQHKQGQQAQEPQQPQQGTQGRSGQQAQQPQQSTQGRSSQETQQRQLSPQQGQTTTGAASQQPSQQQGQAKSGSTVQQQQTGQAGRAGNATVTLNESQRTRIRETVLVRSDVPRVDRVDFALTVGTFVPERVHLVAVPEELITIRPEWREDMYFVSGDDIIIVDHSHRIVAVVAAGPTTAMNSREYGSYASTRGTSANLSTEEIRQLQIALNQKGFDVGNPDGVLGSRTRQALIAFQKQQGFQASGQFDQQTMTALGVSANNAGAQGGAASSTGQGGTSNKPAATQNGSSNGGSNMPAATSGQGTSGSTNMPSRTPGSSGSTNMPSHTQGTSGGSTTMPSHTQGSSGSTNMPSGQSK